MSADLIRCRELGIHRRADVRIITLNLNGVRSATSKGFFQWLPKQQADIVCVQELKAQAADITGEMLAPDGYHGYFHCAEKKGYSGVGIYSQRPADHITEGVGIAEIDAEGRYLRADFGQLSIISLYLPSGSSGEHRQAAKFFFLAVSIINFASPAVTANGFSHKTGLPAFSAKIVLET